ncbi:myogenesis-regulating glycosidase-like isoform X2 [Planococcus citri]|uniref:myogenesis-regulating glycosidase-like isoform X2 n=1 Tax=Planococcus citri TaxID=170843 RepID=UPI0031F7BD43
MYHISINKPCSTIGLFGVILLICATIRSGECSLFSNTRVYYEQGVVKLDMIDLPDPDPEPFKIELSMEQPSLEFYSSSNCSSKPTEHCLDFPEHRLLITRTSDRCFNVNFSSPVNKPITATIHLGQLHVYGGAEHAEMQWPIDKIHYVEHAFVTTTYYYQAIVEPYWLTSNGYYIYVDESVPLFVAMEVNKRTLSLTARRELPYVKTASKNSLDFVVCKFQNPRVAQLHAVNTLLGKPADIPDTFRIRHPIWSTWVKFKDSIDENRAMAYAKEIFDRGYTGQIEIDDNWEFCYGSMEPHPGKFPDLKLVVNEIKKMNFRVTIWIHPFVNVECEDVHEMGLESGYFVRNYDNETQMKWWRGHASQIDFTNPRAAKWFKKRLEKLRQLYNIDSFKFDGGESDYSPKPSMFHTMARDHPHTIVKSYVKTISSLGKNVHTRVARGTQKYPVFTTMMDRESVWSNLLGLYTMIPQVLQMNILGYSFVLPDMIGGNAYHIKASEELFIRWVQVNTFMPSMQFSLLPWEFGEKCAEITKKFVDLHYNYSDKIINLMRKNVQTGAPVNPPIWWIAPTDKVALKCDNEFLLGEDTLIAPVLIEGKTCRDIYLPAGYWKDENYPERAIIQGPTWLKNYEAPLEVLPYFTKMTANQVETLVYLEAGHYQNNWTIALITLGIVVVVYSVIQVVSRFLRLRKRVLTWYKHSRLSNCFLPK